MRRREDEDAQPSRRTARYKTSPSPARDEDEEETIRNKLRESGWKKRKSEGESAGDAETTKDTKEKAEMDVPRDVDDHESFRMSRISRRSRSPRRREREHRGSRKKSSGSRRRSPSRSRSLASRSRSRSRSHSRSTGRRRRHHSSSLRKRRSSRSVSRNRDGKKEDKMRKIVEKESGKKQEMEEKEYEKKEPRQKRINILLLPQILPLLVLELPLPAPSTGVNPTITQLMAQYPTMSLQDIIAKMQASNVTMAAAVAQKPARELYVGNLPPNVTGPQLQEFLSTIIQQVGLTTQPGNPIVNTWISTDGHFAFCEMRSVEECNLALLLNQLSLLGQPLKFGRPRSFMGPPQPMPQILARTQTALTNLGCTPNPAWFAQPSISSITEATADLSALSRSTTAVVSNFEPAVTATATEDQVKELVEPFGALRSFTLVKDAATGASMGSALFEYEDQDVAAQAVEGLNGLSIGGILLSVQRQSLASGAALGLLPRAAPSPEDQPSAVLKMANMVSVDELRDDEEYADLAEDVEEECKRFGNVTGLEIPRPKTGEEVPGLGCIYVCFGKEEDAASALKALNGRKFGGNIVKVTYFPGNKFEKREFS
ncbi:unnamed protein product [Peronospora destructor]|uniref:RRM domain-containing protein n=1 Tax=Peronospora destructor TaxID=86335 RepID=A0AAV0TLU1_9STRA|nr:unnamed protein product [Peronospora destructor]